MGARFILVLAVSIAVIAFAAWIIMRARSTTAQIRSGPQDQRKDRDHGNKAA